LTDAAVDAAVAALRDGKVVVLPTDTVYGLCADAYRPEAAARLAELKGRPEGMPLSLLSARLDALLDCVPELRDGFELIAQALLPGPFTLVLPNPAHRFDWLTGERPDTIGVRVPVLPSESAAVLDQAGPVASTSANLHGGPDPRSVADLPDELRAAVAATVDAGALPGTPSTVVDLTGAEPLILREGAVSAEETLTRIAAALR
jgi:L-threonylcarbamoyladenylate synthase